MRWAGHVAHVLQKRNAYKILVGKSEVKILLERPSSKWKDNIEMALREMGMEGVDSI
jgi:hypothetical protein